MKKSGLLVLCLILSGVFLSACNSQPEQTIKYERKLEKYFKSESSQTPSGGMIDLSEGPKLHYDAKLGPKDLNFDFKIVNPY